MLRKSLYCKIHMATVTAALPDYIGSITIDADILDQIGLRVNDAVTVANCRNGERFETYVFRGEPGSKRIEINGAAAHLVEPGDRVIIMHYAHMTDEEYAAHRPAAAIMNPDNTIDEIMRYESDRAPSRVF
ncbi:MAG: aspartate 1-decarboxylase [Phycisphaerales bacterium]|jgi:aspartate 1-decarboxylase|nr:aspartate 1-decarboxylase [Phycisphaerales bacterium]